MNIEQICRDLLEQAIKDGLVAKAHKKWDDPDPQCRTAGELAGVANLLVERMRARSAVFVVTCEQYYANSFRVVGVYATRELADAACEGPDYCVEEFTVHREESPPTRTPSP